MSAATQGWAPDALVAVVGVVVVVELELAVVVAVVDGLEALVTEVVVPTEAA